MAALRPDDEWYERLRRQIHGPSLEERTEKILRDVALLGVNSSLFHHLRDSFAEAEPEFLQRMEELNKQP